MRQIKIEEVLKDALDKKYPKPFFTYNDAIKDMYNKLEYKNGKRR